MGHYGSTNNTNGNIQCFIAHGSWNKAYWQFSHIAGFAKNHFN